MKYRIEDKRTHRSNMENQSCREYARTSMGPNIHNVRFSRVVLSFRYSFFDPISSSCFSINWLFRRSTQASHLLWFKLWDCSYTTLNTLLGEIEIPVSFLLGVPTVFDWWIPWCKRLGIHNWVNGVGQLHLQVECKDTKSTSSSLSFLPH
jgi:hypothetical protein